MKHTSAREYISALSLKPHPEGGYYCETYRDPRQYDFLGGQAGFEGKRNFSTAIYFLMERENFSAFHRIKSDEVWHFYAGSALEVVEINASGRLVKTRLGSNIGAGEVFQYVVKAGNWFGSRVLAGGQFSLVGCTVAPGFDFSDFEMADRDELLREFPMHSEVIAELTR